MRDITMRTEIVNRLIDSQEELDKLPGKYKGEKFDKVDYEALSDSKLLDFYETVIKLRLKEQ